MCTTDPTILPARNVVLALAFDPLDNHEIAFGVVHFALCPFPRSCAQRWGRYSPRLHGRVGGTSAHPHSASDSSFGVVLRIQTHMRPHGLGRNTSLKPCATPLHPSALSRLSPESPAEWGCTSSARAICRVFRFPVAAHPRLTAALSAAMSNTNPSVFTLSR